MKQDPLTSAYMKVLNENATSGKVEGQSLKTDGSPFGQGSESKKNAENFIKDSGDSKVKSDVKKPTNAPSELTTDGSESEPKELKTTGKLTLKDSLNPFDALFNKIISEDSFNFDSKEGVEPEQHFGGPDHIGTMGDDEGMSDDETFGDEDDSGDYEEDEQEDLGSLISQLKDLVGKLESHLGGEEGEEGEEGEYEFPDDSREDGEDETDEEEDEEINEESVEMDELSNEKGLSLTRKPTHTVRGAVPSVKGKAKVEKGKKVNGKLEDFKNESGISSLQSKSSIDAKGVKTGKFLFDNQSGE